ncbi:helix-turn-helix domain-containing protein [Bacillus sp. REN10]|nr:helix-turn-helix domain-containing protein [Bacillus sp. REN10]
MIKIMIKLQIVKLYENSKSLADIAAEYEITPSSKIVIPDFS